MSGLGPLARFQDDFVAALNEPSTPAAVPTISRLSSQPGFAVYRNTVAKGCIDALQANYPSVARLVGETWFRAAAGIFARRTPPLQPSLLDYGAGFADFLAGFAPAGELPYLADVATLDRLWTESHLAADQAHLSPARFATLDIALLQDAVLVLHCTARWRWFEHHPALAIWRLNRDDHDTSGPSLPFDAAAPADAALTDWLPQGALLARIDATVGATALTQADCVFLDACACGTGLASAVARTLAFDEHADLQDMMARLLLAGAFADILIT
jgi:hypothetical protein